MADFTSAARTTDTIARRASDTTELAAALIPQLRSHHERAAVPVILDLLQLGGYLNFERPLSPAEKRAVVEAIEKGGFSIIPTRPLG